MSTKPTDHQQPEQQIPPPPPPATPAPAPASRIPTAEVRCRACDEPLVIIARTPTAQALLQVYERQVLRPHLLTDDDLPLDWRCPKCGQVTTIGE